MNKTDFEPSINIFKFLEFLKLNSLFKSFIHNKKHDN